MISCFFLLWKQVLLLRLIFHHVRLDEDEFTSEMRSLHNPKDLLATSQ